MEDEAKETPDPPEELPFPLHKVFVDVSLENDLKGEDLEWFKSRISRRQDEDRKERKPVSGPERTKVEIHTEYKLEKPSDKPNRLLLRVTETDTIWFLSLESNFSQEDPVDAERVRRENEAYLKKKTKKEIIRKRCMADSQTPRFMIKSSETITTEIVMKDCAITATEWDLYDTYKAIDLLKEAQSKISLKVGDTKTEVKAVAPTEEEVARTFRSSPFKYASLVTERLLASNCYQSKQSIFKTDFKTRYYTGPTKFSYDMNLLWSFEVELEDPLTVTAMDWNPLNQDLLAVGYGDLNFEKGSFGMICVWSSKNPRQPERRIRLEDSVTSLHYSRSRPNMLAVGTRAGNVYVWDVSAEDGRIRNLGSDGFKPHPGPIWKVEWYLRRELDTETEELLAVGESGVVLVFSTAIEKETKGILTLTYVTSTRKLLEKLPPKKILRRLVFHDEVFDKKVFSGLSFSICSDRNFCYISTKEGAILRCNLMNPSMTDGIFLAHDGPVYAIQHSPVTDLVFLTCGADWRIKIWMEGIPNPLFTLQQKAPVVCARWSPTIPTLIACVAEKELSLWDFARNVLVPKAVINFEDCGKPLSTFLFSSNGANLMVGCEDGLVRVVHLSELPRIPFLQKEALISAIRRILIRNKDKLYHEFRRAVDSNREKLKTQVIDRLERP